MKTIDIIIDANGQATLQTKGFAGESCRQASKLIEQALGLTESDQPTSELYQNATSQEAERHKIGGQ